MDTTEILSFLVYNKLQIFLYINPLNAELNPICHLLILLGDLTFMGKYIVSISNKMQRHTVYLYLETALHVSGGTSTHHQERIQLYLSIGICHTVPAICRYRGRVGTGWSVLWVANAVSTHQIHQPTATWVNTTRYYKYSQVLLMMGENIARNM
jgi:hypothetical protein